MKYKDWNALARNTLKSELARKGFSHQELVNKLAEQLVSKNLSTALIQSFIAALLVASFSCNP